jgi:hypothetical protein
VCIQAQRQYVANPLGDARSNQRNNLAGNCEEAAPDICEREAAADSEQPMPMPIPELPAFDMVAIRARRDEDEEDQDQDQVEEEEEEDFEMDMLRGMGRSIVHLRPGNLGPAGQQHCWWAVLCPSTPFSTTAAAAAGVVEVDRAEAPIGAKYKAIDAILLSKVYIHRLSPILR